MGGRSRSVGSAGGRRRRSGLGLLVALSAVLLLPAAAGAGEHGPRRWPLAGSPEVSRAFAPPEVRYAAGHRGVDLAAPAGAPVLAAAAGRVTYAGLLAGRGVVVVSHGELRTTYEPVTAAVEVGAVVDAGSVLGRLEAGHLGCPVAACLHWGLKRGQDYLDPVRFVGGGPVRLLPSDRELSGGSAAAGAAPPSRPVAVGGLGGGRLAGGPSTGSRPAGPPAVAHSSTAPPPAAPAPPAAAEAEPRWSLQSAEAPLGAAAVAALVAGIGLLARPRPPSPGPVSGGAAVPAPVPVDEPAAPPGELVDLAAARVRRRSG